MRRTGRAIPVDWNCGRGRVSCLNHICKSACQSTTSLPHQRQSTEKIYIFLLFLCAWCDSSSQHVFPAPVSSCSTAREILLCTTFCVQRCCLWLLRHTRARINPAADKGLPYILLWATLLNIIIDNVTYANCPPRERTRFEDGASAL